MSHQMESDEEFKASIRTFANDLSRHGQEFDTAITEFKVSQLEFSLQKAFNNDDRLVQEFLIICDTISQNYDIFAKNGKKHPLGQRSTFKRNKEQQIDLALLTVAMNAGC